jgi:hypothetical protein
MKQSDRGLAMGVSVPRALPAQKDLIVQRTGYLVGEISGGES